jgi:hypothetical protein
LSRLCLPFSGRNTRPIFTKIGKLAGDRNFKINLPGVSLGNQLPVLCACAVNVYGIIGLCGTIAKISRMIGNIHLTNF